MCQDTVLSPLLGTLLYANTVYLIYIFIESCCFEEENQVLARLSYCHTSHHSLVREGKLHRSGDQLPFYPIILVHKLIFMFIYKMSYQAIFSPLLAPKLEFFKLWAEIC